MSDTAKPDIEHFRISPAKADALIREHMPAFKPVSVPLDEASGRILAENIIAERDQPPFNRATMDGIAINSAAAGNELVIEGVQAAGANAATLNSANACMEIMTGAAMPEGSDTVIPVERISVSNNTATIEPGYVFEPGQFVHTQASDHATGDVLLEPGITIGPTEMAALTAAGKPEVLVNALPSIAVISTGDELVDVGAPISDTQIRSSNDRAIETSLILHHLSNVKRSHIKDDANELRTQLGSLLNKHDVLILSGGVSMGKFDYIPGVLQELGIEVIFHKITQRPGLPMWFGVSKTGQPVFALPGNPVSTLVCLTRYVVPALLKACGQKSSPAETAKLAKALEFKPALSWFVPVTLESRNGELQATPKTTNTSGDFVALANTAGFIELEAGQDSFEKGHVAKLWRW